MFDVISYVIGKKQAASQVVISGDSDYTFNDTSGEGDIVIDSKEEGE